MTRVPALAPLVLAAACSGGGPSAPEPAARNLLLITVDTLRADHLGSYGYDLPTSPAVDALAARSVVFEDVQGHTSWTLPSLASLMTSLYSSTHGCFTAKSRLGAPFTTLAEVLRAGGWRTAAVGSHVFLAEKYGLHQGFEHFDVELVRANLKQSHEAVTSHAVTDKGLAWLAERDPDERWFLWLHYFDPHGIYRRHEGITQAFGARGQRAAYDGEIAYTDRHVGRVLDALDASAHADDTVVVFTADHGEEFGEHGGTRHGSTLYREVVELPLLVHVPGLAHRRVEETVRGVDVLPTLLELLAVEPSVPLAGSSLVPALTGAPVAERAAVAELERKAGGRLVSIVRGRWKLVVDRRDDASALYDRAADPGETTDRLADEPAVAAELRAELERELERARALAGRLAPAGGRGGAVELTADEQQALRDLGYVGD